MRHHLKGNSIDQMYSAKQSNYQVMQEVNASLKAEINQLKQLNTKLIEKVDYL